jgi:hypothetical protein
VVLATILFVAIGLVVGSILEGGRAVRIDYYRVIDQHTLVVGAETEDGEWTRVTGVDETATTVTIAVKGLQAPIRGAGGGGGQGIEFPVRLRDPIGSRTVVDGSRGEVVEFTRCLQPVPLRQGCR